METLVLSNTATRRDLLLAGLALAASGGALSQTKTPARFRVAVGGDYEHLALKHARWETLGEEVEIVSFNKPFNSPQETVAAFRDFDAVLLMRERVPMPREMLQQLPRLKLIVFSGLMNATLDHAAAAERNILVLRALGMEGDDDAPGGGPAELALALMLACAWHIPQADALIRKGGWVMQPEIPIKIPLGGKVLGIAGYGGIGASAGRYGKALGMKVLGFSRSLTDEIARADGVTRADLETLLRTSDVISIHLPLTAQTKGMIGARQISLMKPGVVLINTARAGIVDEAPMIEALRTRKIAIAGFDVFSKEPLPQAHPLLQLPNVVMTPHIGYISEAALASRYEAMLDVVLGYRQGTLTIKDRYVPSARDG